MKKLIGLIVILFFSCQKDINTFTYVPYDLEIPEVSGIKLQSYIVQDKVQINVKLPESGQYRIRIYDFENKLVSQELLRGEKGDNILNVYVNALPASSYTVALYDNNLLIGKEYFTNE
jgi:hypothetical protein